MGENLLAPLGEDGKRRCSWSLSTLQYQRYHDEEWGKPCHDEHRLFEMLLLEGAQAGLSWRTILEKREGYRTLFDNFDAKKMARYTDAQLEKKLLDARIVRNRLKVFGFRRNAQAYLKLCEEFGSLDAWLWKHVDGQPVRNHWTAMKQVPASTPLSDAISKALKKRGFAHVGPTTMYALMEAIGIVDDHLVGCHRRGASGVW